MGLVQWVDKLRNSFSYDDEMLENDYAYDDYDDLNSEDNYSENIVDIDLVNDEHKEYNTIRNSYHSVDDEYTINDDTHIDSNYSNDNKSIDDYDELEDYDDFDTDDISPFSASHYINIKSNTERNKDDFVVNNASTSEGEKSIYSKIKSIGDKIKINESKLNDYKNKIMLEEVEDMSYDEQKPQMVYDLNRNIQIETNSLAVLEVNLSTFDDVKEICAAIKSGNGVICYMSNVEAQIANQYICYLNGFCSALNAQMNKISEATFILTPKQVRYVKVEERERYNRSNLNNIRRSAM